MADQFQVEQVLMNLATNARDAMPDGGTLTMRTGIEEIGEEFVKSNGYGKPGAYARLSVSDTGTGMDSETKRRLFEPFYTTKKTGKGTGLGMSMVYGIVKQHNAYITIDSEPGIGTTVNIFFPAVAISHTEASVPVENSPAAGGNETILLAEDEVDVRELIRSLLEEAGYSVIEARDGEEAVEAFKAHADEIDLLILDVIMPRMNGKQAFDNIRHLKKDMRTIFMSGYNEEIIHKKGILKTGLTLMSKPILPTLLLSKVREVLDRGTP
jgi:CheY-like chemotaxis protein